MEIFMTHAPWIPPLILALTSLGCGLLGDGSSNGDEDAAVPLDTAQPPHDASEDAPQDTGPDLDPCTEPDATRTVTCGDGCSLQTERCTDGYWLREGDCISDRRTEPDDREEKCIPAGTFIRGGECPYGDDFPEDEELVCSTFQWRSQPASEVHLSAYYIDRFAVTHEAYLDCMENGPCTLPDDNSHSVETLNWPEAWTDSLARQPLVGVTFEQAETFCAWDGARQLPTEAQWEKAARGPAPRTNRYPWDGDDFDCDNMQSGDRCGPHDGPSRPTTDIDTFPGEASYYGVQNLVGMGAQWTMDGIQGSDNQYEEYPGPDPHYPYEPGISSYRIVRGSARNGYRQPIADRKQYGNYPTGPLSGLVGIRCVRPVEITLDH
jgi:formylglycine-generating enzyme required for sulfatase activity